MDRRFKTWFSQEQLYSKSGTKGTTEITRYRNDMIAETSQRINRIQKVLAGANIKFASVITDIK
jgi:hypothetical protein